MAFCRYRQAVLSREFCQGAWARHRVNSGALLGFFADTPLDEITPEEVARLKTTRQRAHASQPKLLKNWRRGPGSNRRIKVLQTSPLPLGYRALAGLPLFEPLPNRRSQPGGRRRAIWSGRRDLNSRPSPWQGDALPLSYSRIRNPRKIPLCSHLPRAGTSISKHRTFAK